MKLVTALSAAAFVLVPAVGLAQAPANGTENTKNEPGVVEKAIGNITGHPLIAKQKESTGDTNYPDFNAIKKTDK
ncbi:MAG TPA: hypothetical protein VHT02_03825 [Methylocella sp.]|nr:hypothetical protein [Methylocella sp.]